MGSDRIWKFVESRSPDDQLVSRYPTVDVALVMAFESASALMRFDRSHTRFKGIQRLRSLAHLLPSMFC